MLELLKMLTTDLIFTLIVPGLFAGVGLLLFSKFIPSVLAEYKLPAFYGGIFLVLFFTFEAGRYIEVEKAKLAEAEARVTISALKAKAAEITTVEVVKYVDKIKYVSAIQEVPVNVYVPIQADQKCVIDPSTSDAIRLHYNSSLEGKLSSTASTINGATK